MSNPILPIEQQYAAPGLCQRLVELGAPTGTAYRWQVHYEGMAPVLVAAPPEVWKNGLSIFHLPAYSVADLGRLLKLMFTHQINEREMVMDTEQTRLVLLWDNGRECESAVFTDVSTEADLRARLLINLMERGYSFAVDSKEGVSS